MRTILNCKQVSKDIRKNYYAADLFLDKVLDALLSEVALQKFGIEAVNSNANLPTEEGNDHKFVS